MKRHTEKEDFYANDLMLYMSNRLYVTCIAAGNPQNQTIKFMAPFIMEFSYWVCLVNCFIYPLPNDLACSKSTI